MQYHEKELFVAGFDSFQPITQTGYVRQTLLNGPWIRKPREFLEMLAFLAGSASRCPVGAIYLDANGIAHVNDRPNSHFQI